MRRLNCGFASRTYHIVGNLLHWLILFHRGPYEPPSRGQLLLERVHTSISNATCDFPGKGGGGGGGGTPGPAHAQPGMIPI